MSDAPEGPLDTRGGMKAGNPGLEGATETGRQGVAYSDTGDEAAGGEEPDRRLPAEQDGNAGAGTG